MAGLVARKTNTGRPAYCVFCPRHKHSISFPKAFTDSKKTKPEPKKKNTDDDIPQKTDLKIFLEECILLEKANLLFCSFVHFDKFLVAALTHPTCQRGWKASVSHKTAIILRFSADFMDTKMTNREVGPQLESLQTAFGHLGFVICCAKRVMLKGTFNYENEYCCEDWRIWLKKEIIPILKCLCIV